MNSNFKCDAKDLNYLILNCKFPLRFENFLNCDLIRWNLNKWSDVLKEETLEFRCGKNEFTKEPQWERTTNIMKWKFNDFTKYAESENKDWMYFDYKYLREYLVNNEEIRNNISWDLIGFPEKTVDDSTIWIGSKGAHTPCHIDTYGCNVVFQIYGRKQWLVFPPDENLLATRIPYEESSIYSKLNFFSPDLDCFKCVDNCYKIVLNPGDALFLPHGWWHYVENLETAISINMWIPEAKDDKERLHESIVQLIIHQFTKDLSATENNIIVNPNTLEELEKCNLQQLLKIVNHCRNAQTNLNKRHKTNNTSTENKCLIEEIIQKYGFIKKVQKLTKEEFSYFLETQRTRFTFEDCNKVEKKDEENDEFHRTTDLINAIIHPDVISLIIDKLNKL